VEFLESKIQAKIIKKLESEDWFVIKLTKTNKSGIPDILAIRNGRTIFIEVKTERGKLSQLQKYQINEIKSKNIECFVWTEFGVNFDKGDETIFKS